MRYAFLGIGDVWAQPSREGGLHGVVSTPRGRMPTGVHLVPTTVPRRGRGHPRSGLAVWQRDVRRETTLSRTAPEHGRRREEEKKKSLSRFWHCCPEARRSRVSPGSTRRSLDGAVERSWASGVAREDAPATILPPGMDLVRSVGRRRAASAHVSRMPVQAVTRRWSAGATTSSARAAT